MILDLRRDWAVPAGVLVGFLLPFSLGKCSDSAEAGERQAFQASRALLAEADLGRLHHEVYAAVGERRWEGSVKPDFLRDLTLATVRDTGNPFPDWTDVIRWARTHPREASDLLRRHLPAAGPPP
jgi:hypothetical protein